MYVLLEKQDFEPSTNGHTITDNKFKSSGNLKKNIFTPVDMFLCRYDATNNRCNKHIIFIENIFIIYYNTAVSKSKTLFHFFLSAFFWLKKKYKVCKKCSEKLKLFAECAICT